MPRAMSRLIARPRRRLPACAPGSRHLHERWKIRSSCSADAAPRVAHADATSSSRLAEHSMVTDPPGSVNFTRWTEVEHDLLHLLAVGACASVGGAAAMAPQPLGRTAARCAPRTGQHLVQRDGLHVVVHRALPARELSTR
jgi:hypothetical protein